MTHDLSLFFECNRIPFTAVDPFNVHLKSAYARFIAKTGLAEQPIKMPKVFIFGTEVTISRVRELAGKGLIIPILRRQRCIGCLHSLHKKPTQCKCAPDNEEQKLEPEAIQPIFNETMDMSSSNLFIVPEEIESEAHNSTAEKKIIKAVRSSAKPACASKDKGHGTRVDVKPRTPSAKMPAGPISGIGRGLRKTVSKKQLHAPGAAKPNSTLLDISSASISMSQFGDVSTIINVDDS